MKKKIIILQILMGFMQSVLSMNNRLINDASSKLDPQVSRGLDQEIDSFILKDMEDFKKGLFVPFSYKSDNYTLLRNNTEIENKNNMYLINYLFTTNDHFIQLLKNYMNSDQQDKEELFNKIIKEIENKSTINIIGMDRFKEFSLLIAMVQAAKLIVKIENFSSLIHDYINNDNNYLIHLENFKDDHCYLNFNRYDYCLNDNDIDLIDKTNTNEIKILKHHLKKHLLSKEILKKLTLVNEERKITDDQQTTRTFKTKIINFIKKVVRPISMTFIVGSMVLLFFL
jgi:hypothetical protein